VGGQSTQPLCLSLLHTRRLISYSLASMGSIPITGRSHTDPPALDACLFSFSIVLIQILPPLLLFFFSFPDNSTTQQINNSTTQQLNNSTTQQLNNSTTRQCE
jgi:hypothetical protein